MRDGGAPALGGDVAIWFKRATPREGKKEEKVKKRGWTSRTSGGGCSSTVGDTAL